MIFQKPAVIAYTIKINDKEQAANLLVKQTAEMIINQSAHVTFGQSKFEL